MTMQSAGDMQLANNGQVRVWDGTQWIPLDNSQIMITNNTDSLTYTTIAPTTTTAHIPWTLGSEPGPEPPTEEEISQALKSIREAMPRKKVEKLSAPDQWDRHRDGNPGHTATLRDHGITCNDCLWRSHA